MKKKFTHEVLWLLGIGIILAIFMFALNAKARTYCPITEEVNLSSESWTEVDQAEMEISRAFCAKNYANDFPCLVRFTKNDGHMYETTCGAKESFELPHAKDM